MKFGSNDSYIEDMKVYTEKVLSKSGISSRSAEREVMYLAEQGNTVCLKLYGDMLHYGKIMDRHRFREALRLYLRAADIRVNGGEWSAGDRAYPEAYWSIGYYLVHYKREHDLGDCEKIEEIESMELSARFRLAAELTLACLREVEVPGALNLLGRIFQEAAEEEALRSAVIPVFGESLPESIRNLLGDPADLSDAGGCEAASIRFFEASAEAGYVYACNNLAARAADRLVELGEDGDPAEIKKVLEQYIRWLRIAADRYETYAANRLGLFYRTGEVRGTGGEVHFREYTDSALGREYFYKATRYPDANSAWAYLNLMKYYHQDYDRDIDLLNEHMEIMRELNPKVYDIAMEL